MSLQQQMTQPISLASLLFMGTPSYKQAAATYTAKRNISSTDKLFKEMDERFEQMDPNKDMILAEATGEQVIKLASERLEAAEELRRLNPSEENVMLERNYRNEYLTATDTVHSVLRNPEKFRIFANQSVQARQDEIRKVRPEGLNKSRAVNPEGIKKAKEVKPEGVSK